MPPESSPWDNVETSDEPVGEIDILTLPGFEASVPTVREAKLLSDAPWCRSVIGLEMRVQTEGWKFPAPTTGEAPPRPGSASVRPLPASSGLGIVDASERDGEAKKPKIRPRPTGDTVLFKDRLLYMLQPPLDHLFVGKQVPVPFKPFPYQLEGIAFLMPRHCALLADEMGLGKTAQAILSIRLLFQAGLLKRVLVVCPKPLVFNWARELDLWAADMPYELISGDNEQRRIGWMVSNSPVKVVNYESLTRDLEFAHDKRIGFDLVVLDEAQRIKNRDSKTAQAVRGLKRERSWAITGTPIENRPEDLVNIFAFLDEDRIPQDTPPRRIPALTGDSILRRTKDDVQSDMPPKLMRDMCLELTNAQREAYDLAESEGIVRLNDLGDTVTLQHVFSLVMRLKQICNFDPRTGSSAKLEQLLVDMQEVAESNRKAIIFSQWVEPLEVIAAALKEYNPLQFHGKIPSNKRTAVLDQFKNDPSSHVILMSYGTGSVGLNLQFSNYVFLFDRWWNPAVEDQAINRAHRIGQRHPVTVTRFSSANTIEQRIAEVLESKRRIFAEMLEQNGPPPAMGMSEDEIFQLFDIRGRPKVKAA